MTSETIEVRRTGSATDRYRRAEQALWARYDLAPEEHLIELGSPSVRLRVLEVGSGPPVVFVHGSVGPGSWASLARLGGSPLPLRVSLHLEVRDPLEPAG